MALQPQDESTFVPHAATYVDVETSQCSESRSSNPIVPFTFSRITNIFDDQTSLLFSGYGSAQASDTDSIESTKCLFDPSEMGNEFEEFLSTIEDLPCDESNGWITNTLDTVDLEAADRSMQDRSMSIEIQPPTDIRRRYQSDGKRQIEKSRSKPMTLKLPNLNDCRLQSNQTLWIQLILITSNNNPQKKVYIHTDKLEYHTEDLPNCDHGSVRIPIDQTDIQKGIKQFPRISIIKAKLDTYTSKLMSYNPISTNNQIENLDRNINAKSTVAKAKCFRDIYDLQSSRIACQLLIKQNTNWHMTNIVCETDIMEEKKSESTGKKPSKRSAPLSDSDDEYQLPPQNPAKKRKRTSILKRSLPVTRVKKS